MKKLLLFPTIIILMMALTACAVAAATPQASAVISNASVSARVRQPGLHQG